LRSFDKVMRDNIVASHREQEPETDISPILAMLSYLLARWGELTTIKLHTSQSVGTSHSLLPHLGQRYPPFFNNP
jgi:hypothetical protein